MTENVDFSPLAGAYKRFRVGYGPELEAYIGERLAAGPAGAVLDLACGTGLSTAPLAKWAQGPVIGMDISGVLVRKAPKLVAGTTLRYVLGDATQWPVASATLSAITCAQALHWIPPEPVLLEALRSLRPGGSCFAYWKYPHPDEPYQAPADEILSRMHGRPIRQGFSLKEPPDFRNFGFDTFERVELEMRIPYTLDDYVGFMRSRYRIKELAGDRLEEFIGAYRAEMEKLIRADETIQERNLIFVFGGRKRAVRD